MLGESQGDLMEASDGAMADGGQDHAYVYPLKVLCKVLCLCTLYPDAPFFLCSFYFIVFLKRPLAGLVLHSVLIIPWHCRFPQSQLCVNRSLSHRVGWLINCETLDIWWLCAEMYHSRECHGLGP